MANPFFSVITVTYNSSHFVRDAIGSVLASTFTDFELIIGDDCSTDDTWDIIIEYNDPRIVKYRNESNLKEYPNRNKALKMARGEWVIFIDGDDVIYSHGLAVYATYIQKYDNVSMIIQKNYHNSIIWPIKLEPRQFLVNEFFGSQRLSCSSFSSNVFRRNTLFDIGNLATNYLTGDEDVRLRMGTKYNTLFVAGWLTWPRETPGQAGSRITASTAFIERAIQINKLIKSLRNEETLYEIAFNGDLNHKSALKKLILYFLKNLQFFELLYLIKFFGLFKIFSFEKPNTNYPDEITNQSPTNPYNYKN